MNEADESTPLICPIPSCLTTTFSLHPLRTKPTQQDINTHLLTAHNIPIHSVFTTLAATAKVRHRQRKIWDHHWDYVKERLDAKMRARRRQWREFVANPSIDVPNEVGCEVELEMMRRLAEADWESDRQWMRRVVGEWRWDRDALQERRRAQAVVNAVEAEGSGMEVLFEAIEARVAEAEAGWRSAAAGPGPDGYGDGDGDGDGGGGEAEEDATEIFAFADEEINADPSREERDAQLSK